MLRLVPLGVVLALAAACGGSTVPVVPTSPAPSTASFPGSLNGRWRGYVRVAACSGGFSCATGYTQPFVLSVTNAAAGGYVAALETNFHVRADIELTGAPQSDGTVLFTGVRE